jgi:hypothetical protein
MVEVFGVVVVTSVVGLIVWLIRCLASVISKDERHARLDEANSE